MARTLVSLPYRTVVSIPSKAMGSTSLARWCHCSKRITLLSSPSYPSGARLISTLPPSPIRNHPSAPHRRRSLDMTANTTTISKKTQSKALKDQMLANARPAYVSAPSVSGEDMVNAIESSRISTDPEEVLGKDPFAKGADPFANQLEAAIEASLRNSAARSRSSNGDGSGWRDTRQDRASTRVIEKNRIPDLQAEYLASHARWETVSARDVLIKNVTPKNMPKVAALEHGLDRVLFNPGVHWLQDPRSAVFNFDPYLRKICQPKDFDYSALQEYKTSSMDESLRNIASKHGAKYIGSTSSMTSPKGFTRLSRAPSTIQLVYKGKGIYAIDADKTFDSSTVLMQLGKSMEKMLTSTPKEFSRFTKENSWKVSKEERSAPEAFNYITADGKFMLRSQLDCEDPRLPGKTFDLKTRAAVAIRLDVHNYEQNQGYQLRKSHGILESFEREYYDMMRAAFLKYSLQVRIGQMDGIFVAFHNTARIFGFQYISLDEMDSRLFGSKAMGDECFKNQLRILNRALDEITAHYPEQDLKITMDTDETVQSMNVWVETMPLGAAASARGQDVKVTFDENGAPEMQPDAKLSLWQIVCYSTINDVTTIGPFDLNDRGTDNWELRYKIGRLEKPHMLSEYRRMMAVQAMILSSDEEKAAAEAAAAELAENDEDQVKTEKELEKSERAIRSAAFREGMRNKLRSASERGRIHEERQARLQGDKEFVIWEPKGYVKISDIPATVATPLPRPAPTGETPAQRMKRRLQESQAASSIEPRLAASAIGTTEDDIKSRMENLGKILCWHPIGFAQLIPLADYDLVRKNLNIGLTEPTEKKRFTEIEKRYTSLLKILRPYHNLLTQKWMFPANSEAFSKFERPRLERMAHEMQLSSFEGQSTDELATRVAARQMYHLRNVQHAYFYTDMRKAMLDKNDAEPFRTLDEFMSMETTEEELNRALYGMGVVASGVKLYMQQFTTPVDTVDVLKSLIVKKLFHNERFLTDHSQEEMKFPLIFNRKMFPTRKSLKKIIISPLKPNTTITKTTGLVLGATTTTTTAPDSEPSVEDSSNVSSTETSTQEQPAIKTE
ncbi:hypothetical protein BG004_004940 [Podila humilis]|nr:hypothetical protein BG004_004940 [Podila humilis]